MDSSLGAEGIETKFKSSIDRFSVHNTSVRPRGLVALCIAPWCESRETFFGGFTPGRVMGCSRVFVAEIVTYDE